jgi:hypothetical protein
MEQRLPIFERLRTVTRGQMYFLSLANIANAPDLKGSGFELVDRIPVDFSYQRQDPDPARLQGWLLPYRTTNLHVFDAVLHKVPSRSAPASAPAQ